MSTRITPEIRALVGRKHGPYRVRVEQGAIEKFADAIGDDNPAYRGPDAVAPPTFPDHLPAEGRLSRLAAGLRRRGASRLPGL